ncbi:hypothetical protein CFOL_v3_08707 [Cephalotus follicularis]|uniref:Uncharacterized protein n=1 Tax=Cephalotus follicularis TaxID=3775 RepID=A0A1Q3BBK8_CEPFO|nr:hypothetical protein CFOL_v3_08707 [Cephalotus follicularis]
MEGVGARLGRSSTRYGPATVFNGPVRKWKKRWVHVSPSNNNNNNHHNNHNSLNHHNNINGTPTNGNNGSHVLLYKWTPLAQSNTNNNNNSSNNVSSINGDMNSSKDDTVSATQEPPKRKFKYIPIAVLEEQKLEAAENVDDEVKPSDTDLSAVELTSRTDDFDGKPDINDVPMEECQEDNHLVRQDLNECLDLSLGFNSHDGDTDSKTEG